jgi:hypothetical protein
MVDARHRRDDRRQRGRTDHRAGGGLRRRRRSSAPAAIKAGAKEFIPLPPDAELIAAVLAAVADDDKPMIVRDPAMESVIKLADQVARPRPRS